MEGTAAAQLAAYEDAHPSAVICKVEGIWHAWLPTESGGDEYHGRTEDELLAKLPSR
jgi:hypothetical protein